MLSEVYKKKLAENVEKMIEMRQKYPTRFRHVFGYQQMEQENRYLENQIRHYNSLLNGINNTKT